MTQQQIEILASGIHESATPEGSAECAEIIGTVLATARVKVPDAIMAQLGGCVVQLAESNHLSQADAGRVLAELLLGKARAYEARTAKIS